LSGKEVFMSEDPNHGKHDSAVDMSFPASDPVARGTPTGTEEPRRPVDRKPPIITREQIEHARRSKGTQASVEALRSTEPVDQPDAETVKVRQGTGPRAMVSVLLLSLLAAAAAGAVLIGYFGWM
jgi:hypothetical protein